MKIILCKGQFGGIPDVVTSEAGILVQPQDAGALAEAIIRLTRDEQLRERMGAEARKRYEQLARSG